MTQFIVGAIFGATVALLGMLVGALIVLAGGRHRDR